MSATAQGLPGRARDPSVAQGMARRRRVTDRIAAVLCVAATAIGLLVLASILFTLLYRGLAGISLGVLYKNTAPTGSDGGLANAIVGTVLQTVVGTAIGTPIGLMVGTYLSEYSAGSWLGEAVRFVSDVLLSAPSILIGLFVYQLVVLPSGHFSGFAGCVALAVIVIPIVVRTTEDMLRLIPVEQREAAVALGAPKWKAIVFVCYRAALDGIMTGVLLAVRPHRRRDGTAAVHQPGQPQPDGGHHPPADAHHRVRPRDVQPAGDDLPVCRRQLRGFAAAGLGGARWWSPPAYWR